MKKFILLFCALLLAQMLQGDAIRKDYLTMSGDAKSMAEEEIFEKYGLKVVGSGGGAMTVVRHDTLKTESDKPLSIAEARRLLVSCTEILLKHINAYRPLRPFLFEYPFPHKRISFSIFISREAEAKMAKDLPTVFSLHEGRIKYLVDADVGNKPAPLRSVFKETYEEAVQIVANEQISQSSSSISAKKAEKYVESHVTEFVRDGEEDSSIPRYVGPQEERDMSWHLDRYATTVAQKYGMEFHRAESFSDEPEDVYSLMFIDFHQMTFEQGKKLAFTLVVDFLRELKASPVVKRYHEYRNNSYKNAKFPPSLTREPVPEQMALKIGFWDKNFDRPKKPYLAEIVFLCGNFYFYEAHPETQALQLILKESYQDAVQRSQG